MMTPEEFDQLPTIKKLLEAKDYVKASNIAYAMGNVQKNNELRKHSSDLAKKAKSP